jgi:plasmid stability protein
MEQALIRKLKPGTLGAYRAVAKAHGRSLEAELRDVIERNCPKIRMTPAERKSHSDALVAGMKMGSDSATIIHEARMELDARRAQIDAGH